MIAAADIYPDEQVGRYAIFHCIAKGGMARVHLARLAGPEGFSRVVAVKRMHAGLLQNPDLKRMFVAEARMAARVRHPNVVSMLDVLVQGEEVLLVMEYVHGESLQALLAGTRRAQGRIALPIGCAVMLGVLNGLRAAHEARDERGDAMNLVHRDVSPHNIMVGVDGIVRLLDFGVARAIHIPEAKPDALKGKLSYMAPEVLRGEPPTRSADLFSASVVFWEMLAGKKLFSGATERDRMRAILAGDYPSVRAVDPRVPFELDRIVMRGLRTNTEERYVSALEMAIDIERQVPAPSQRLVGEWVTEVAEQKLRERAELIHQIESSLPVESPDPSLGSTAAGPLTRDPSRSGAFTVRPPALVSWRFLGIGLLALAATVSALTMRRSSEMRVQTAMSAAPAIDPAASPPERVTQVVSEVPPESAPPASAVAQLPPPEPPASTVRRTPPVKPAPRTAPIKRGRPSKGAKDYLPNEL